MKDALRLRFRAVRDALGPERRRLASEAIARSFAELPRYATARTLLLYASFGTEVDTREIREVALRDGKTVLLPRIEGRELRLHPWIAGQSLAPNRHGIMEPLPDAPVAEPRTIDLVAVPGLAFDDRGARLGYGGGYYDRLLGTIPHAFRVGICFAKQVVPQLPSTHLDAPMDCLVTEDGVKQLPRRHH